MIMIDTNLRTVNISQDQLRSISMGVSSRPSPLVESLILSHMTQWIEESSFGHGRDPEQIILCNRSLRMISTREKWLCKKYVASPAAQLQV